MDESIDELPKARLRVGMQGWILIFLGAIAKFVSVSLVTGPAAIPSVKGLFQGGGSVISLTGRIAIVLDDFAWVVMGLGAMLVAVSIAFRLYQVHQED